MIKVEYWHTDLAWLAQVWSGAEGIKCWKYQFLAPTWTANLSY
jgi:hypothetical protein